jgi:hypothetical protein
MSFGLILIALSKPAIATSPGPFFAGDQRSRGVFPQATLSTLLLATHVVDQI